jgi:hypothetical protein
MADAGERPEDSAGANPPAARKASAKKAPARKAPAKKAPAKKAAVKKAPAKKAPAKKAQPAPEATAARQAAANAKSSVKDVEEPVALLPVRDGGDYRLPVSLALAAAGLVALVLSRFRRD